ncbi:MAG: hypothetical protein GWN58_67735 [Anaerolineae bacterium]|nr:hypothetical protein [Anaerolineae bacterium]
MQGIDPTFVPCDHESFSFKGGRFSKSRGATVVTSFFLRGYDSAALSEGQMLCQLAPPFENLDESATEQEYARLEG